VQVIPLFWLGSPLSIAAILTMLRETRDKGVSPQVAYTLSIVQLIHWQSQNRLRESYMCSLVAENLLQRYGEQASTMRTRTRCNILSVVLPWANVPLRRCATELLALFEEALSMQDLEWQSNICTNYADYQQGANVPLAEARANNQHMLQSLTKRNMMQPAQRTELYMAYSDELELKTTVLTDGTLIHAGESLLVQSTRQMLTGLSFYYRRKFEESRVLLDTSVAAISVIPG